MVPRPRRAFLGHFLAGNANGMEIIAKTIISKCAIFSDKARTHSHIADAPRTRWWCLSQPLTTDACNFHWKVISSSAHRVLTFHVARPVPRVLSTATTHVEHQTNDSYTNCSISCNFSDFHCCKTMRITFMVRAMPYDDDGLVGGASVLLLYLCWLLVELGCGCVCVITETNAHTRNSFSTNYILLLHLIDIVLIVGETFVSISFNLTVSNRSCIAYMCVYVCCVRLFARG